MNNNILGIDIGSNNIALALIKKEKQIEVLKTVIIPTPLESVDNGEILNIEEVANVIKFILKKDKIKAKELAIAISCNQNVIRAFEFQAVKPNELNKAIEVYTAQNLPGIDQSHTISYKVYEQTKEYVKGIVATCPNNIINNYIELGKKIGIPLKHLDIGASCIAKTYNKLVKDKDDKSSVVIVDIGHKISQVNIVNDGKLVISRNVFNGGYDIDRLIANRINISLEKAEIDKKKNFSKYLRAGFEPDSYIRDGYMDIHQEIAQTINYYYESGNTEKIKKILLIGGGSLVSGIETYLSEKFNIPTAIVRSTDNNYFYVSDFSRLMVAIGAAIREG